MPDRAAPSLRGLAACLGALEGEALALGHTLAAHLIATAAAELNVSAADGGDQQGQLRHPDPSSAEAA